ncbi:hypothetical protein ACYOEI_20310 [Singulisphaera rosea]
MIDSRLAPRRAFLAIALTTPLSFLGCGGSNDGNHVEISDATKAEVKSRAEMYRSRVSQKKLAKKKKNSSKR